MRRCPLCAKSGHTPYSITSSANNRNDSVNVGGRFMHCLQLVNPIGDYAAARDVKTE